MRIATRLVLALSVGVCLVVAVYATITQRQREALLRGALVRETETLGNALRIVVDNAVRDGRFVDLDRVLSAVLADPETFAVVVLDSAGQRLAGGMERPLACLVASGARLGRSAGADRGWAECEGPVRWAVLPVRTPAAALVIARHARVLGREVVASRVQHLLLALALAVAITVAIVVVLRRTLSTPLDHIMRGVRAFGGPGPRVPIGVPATAGELGALAQTFEHMADELDARERSLRHQAEERLALERRLSQAETFATVGRLTGGLAHELGSPLNVIGVRAEAIADDPRAPEPVRRQGREIGAEVDRITQLVQALLHVARRREVAAEPVDLTAVITAVAAEIAPLARAARVHVDVARSDAGASADAAPPTVPGDPTLLRHAILNLAVNAVQALATHAGERRVVLRVVHDAHAVRVLIDDTGPGVPSEQLERVFEPFFTTKAVGEGTGLGLALSRGIAEEHGGALRLEPREAGGVRAVLVLPRARTLRRPADARTPQGVEVPTATAAGG
jgi:signal transduction histidine kinase